MEPGLTAARKEVGPARLDGGGRLHQRRRQQVLALRRRRGGLLHPRRRRLLVVLLVVVDGLVRLLVDLVGKARRQRPLRRIDSSVITTALAGMAGMAWPEPMRPRSAC